MAQTNLVGQIDRQTSETRLLDQYKLRILGWFPVKSGLEELSYARVIRFRSVRTNMVYVGATKTDACDRRRSRDAARMLLLHWNVHYMCRSGVQRLRRFESWIV